MTLFSWSKLLLEMGYNCLILAVLRICFKMLYTMAFTIILSLHLGEMWGIYISGLNCPNWQSCFTHWLTSVLWSWNIFSILFLSELVYLDRDTSLLPLVTNESSGTVLSPPLFDNTAELNLVYHYCSRDHYPGFISSTNFWNWDFFDFLWLLHC